MSEFKGIQPLIDRFKKLDKGLLKLIAQKGASVVLEQARMANSNKLVK